MLLLVNGELFRCQHAICSHATCDRDTCRSQFTLWAAWMMQLPPPRRASVGNAVGRLNMSRLQRNLELHVKRLHSGAYALLHGLVDLTKQGARA